MNKIALLVLATLATFTAQASIIETKFKVTGQFIDESGNSRKLTSSKVIIRYNSEANIFNSKDDCVIASGKQDITSECVSSKTYVLTSQDVVKDVFYRPTILSRADISDVFEQIQANATITEVVSDDVIPGINVRTAAKSLLGNVPSIQTISLEGMTQLTLKADGRAKFVIMLQPVKSKILK